MSKKVRPITRRPHYSEERSQAVWREVNATGDDSLYHLGCVLQEVETRFLHALARATRKSKGGQ